jgi:hypothetical protein
MVPRGRYADGSISESTINATGSKFQVTEKWLDVATTPWAIQIGMEFKLFIKIKTEDKKRYMTPF